MKGGKIKPAKSGIYVSYHPYVDVWQRKDFFSQLISDNKFVGDGQWAMFALSPNPYLYYFRHFGVFPLITSDIMQTEETYIEAINSDPGGSSADAIGYVGEIVVFSSYYGSSIYYFDESEELSIGFASKIKQPFLS